MARLVSRLNLNTDGSAAHGKVPARSRKHRGRSVRGKDMRSGPPKSGNGGEGDDDACHYYGKSRHRKRECRKKKRGEEKAAANHLQANLAQAEQETPSLSMAVVTPTEVVTHGTQRVEHVFLNEHKVVADLDNGGKHREMRWYLNSGALNHMTSDASIFSELILSVIGSVRFGDGSQVEIAGFGTMLFEFKDGGHHAFHNVYHIPRLRSSILSIG